MRALTAAGEQVRTTGFPAVLDEAEDHYYVLEWSLTAAQRTLFLSQISADRHASDARIKYLTGASDVTRRGSFAPAQASSDARTQLLKIFVGFLEASLVHGGQPRRDSKGGDHDPDDGRTCRRSRPGLRATKPPPRYYGTATRNAAQRSHIRGAQGRLGCTPAQLAAPGGIPHWQCRHHGQDASDADRATRVAGSGPKRLSDGPGGTSAPRH